MPILPRPGNQPTSAWLPRSVQKTGPPLLHLLARREASGQPRAVLRSTGREAFQVALPWAYIPFAEPQSPPLVSGQEEASFWVVCFCYRSPRKG